MVCMMSHEECEVDYIQDLSGQLSLSDEYLTLEKCFYELKSRISEAMNKITENVSQVENAYGNTMNAVKEMKREIIAFLDEFERELEVDALAYKKTNEETMAKLKMALETLQTETQKSDILLSKLRREQKYNSLFVERKRAVSCLLDFNERIYDISTRNCIKDTTLIPTTQLNTILTKENMFGTVVELENEQAPCNSIENLDRNELGQVNIKSDTDKKTCYATGLAFLSEDYLAIADHANKKVKIIDVSYDKIISEIKLSSSPRDVTNILPDQLAVTLREEEKIQLLSIAEGLKKKKQIATNGKCRGIKYDDGNLIVAYDSIIRPKIEILSLNGDVLCRFQTNQSGTVSVNEPKCIGLSPDRKQVYVTDVSKMCIFRFSKSGIVTGTFGRQIFSGMAISTGGSVYTCAKSGSTVYQLSDNLSGVKTVLTMEDGLKEPIALAISNAKNMLYVSCGSDNAKVSNKLHVFKIKLEAE